MTELAQLITIMKSMDARLARMENMFRNPRSLCTSGECVKKSPESLRMSDLDGAHHVAEKQERIMSNDAN